MQDDARLDPLRDALQQAPPGGEQRYAFVAGLVEVRRGVGSTLVDAVNAR